MSGAVIGMLVFSLGMVGAVFLIEKADDSFQRRHPNWRDHEDFVP